MDSAQEMKDRACQSIAELPGDSLEELLCFIDFLKYKHKITTPARVIALEGLWKDLSFDVMDEDIRALRRELSAEILLKA